MTGLREGPPLRTGDLFLARLLSRRPYRWSVFTVLFLTATASLYYRVGLGGSVQVLPWYGAVLSLYFLALAAGSRDARCRAAHVAFGMLVALVFSREMLESQARLVGALEVAACLVTLAALSSLARDRTFLSRGAVLESETNQTSEDEASRHTRGD